MADRIRFEDPRTVLKRHGLSPKHSWGQNFLVSGRAISIIASACVDQIGTGGTDKHLRHYLTEATFWARRGPRYRTTYERMLDRRGPKIARVVVARMMLRSIHKMLRAQVRFNRLRVA